jgi:hypothetical protein
MCCKNGSGNDNACDQLWTCVECQFMLKGRGDHAHQILSRCMYVPRVMVIFVHLGLLQKQLGKISVTEFFGHDNVEN